MSAKAKRIFTAFTILLLISGCSISDPDQSDKSVDLTLTPVSELENAFSTQRSDFTVTVKGSITRILSDDMVGDRHQRFIIKMSNKQTLLITHNIDIAQRVAGIAVGSMVYVHGDYVWNNEGGLVHWTHKDPDGSHENGWIMFNGERFE